jgi:hypothetical protein
MARELGWSIARDMLVAASTYETDALHAAGFVHRIGDVETAVAWAGELAQLAPLTMAAHKLTLERLAPALPADADVTAAAAHGRRAGICHPLDAWTTLSGTTLVRKGVAGTTPEEPSLQVMASINCRMLVVGKGLLAAADAPRPPHHHPVQQKHGGRRSQCRGEICEICLDRVNQPGVALPLLPPDPGPIHALT